MNQIDLPSNPRLKVKSRVVEKQSDDFGRKQWTVEHYEQLEDHLVEPSLQQRSQKYLIARTQKLDLQKKHKKQGFYCQVCNQLFKCDIAYLTHINSQFHNNKLGMSLKVQASSLSDVKNKLMKLSSLNPVNKMKQKINQRKNKMQSIIKKQLQNAIKINSPSQEQVDQESQQISESDRSQEKQNNVQNSEKQQQSVSLLEQNIQPEINSNKKQEQKEEQDQQQDPDEAMMRALGLPTSFKSKKK